MSLKLVPSADPSPVEQMRQRIRRMARPDGMLQCNQCGGRTLLTTVNSVVIRNGRKTGGTVIEKDICAHCWRDGIIVSMLPELKPI